MARGLARPGRRGSFNYASKEVLMNKNVMQGKWREMKGKVKEQWGRLTDDDLDKIDGKSEQLLGVLQQRYGYAREKAEEEYKRFTDRYSRELPSERAPDAGFRR